MTLTHTVTSIAQDAAHAASDLGSQAADFGRNAVELGSDAASSVATAASHLAQSLANKVPTVTVQKRRTFPWKAVFVLLGVVAALAAFKKSRAPKPSAAAPSPMTPTGVPTGEPAMG
jgi:hypothetical protein